VILYSAWGLPKFGRDCQQVHKKQKFDRGRFNVMKLKDAEVRNSIRLKSQRDLQLSGTK